MKAASDGHLFWDKRHPSLGLPVGCLFVPRRHMSVVIRRLSEEGKAGRGHWLRSHGTVPTNRSSTFHVHLTVFGAFHMEQNDAMLPQPVQELLCRSEISWKPGLRLSETKKQSAVLVPVESDCNFGSDDGGPTGSSLMCCAAPSFRFIELFAGIGGFRLGLEPLGGKCAFSSEIDPFAASTYALNFKRPPTAGDITTVDAMRDIPRNCELLVGGFPCQSFSQAGDQEGLAANHGICNGRLYLEICRVLFTARPRAFLLENVANLYTLDGGKFHRDPRQRKPGLAYTTIMRDLEMCGYTTVTKIVDAHDFNIPQHRDRLLFVGFLDPNDAARFVWPCVVSTTKTVRSILEPTDCEAVKAATLTSDQYRRVQPVLECTDRNCREARLDEIARTLMASYRSGWQKHSEFVVNVAGTARFYTAREAARIMGFPESFVIPGHPTRRHGGKAFDAYQRFYHQIGNAVCPPVIEAVAECILRALDVHIQISKKACPGSKGGKPKLN